MNNLINKDGFLTYDPDFLNPEDAADLFKVLNEKVNWEQKTLIMYEKIIAVPRLTAWFGDNNNYTYSGILNTAQPWIEELTNLKTKIEMHLGLKFNSCLLNLYRNGQDHVSWHSDNERELGINPTIASISLGGIRSFQIKHKEDKNNKIDLLLKSGSLVIMSGPMQHYWLHRLAPTKQEVEPRINITFRMIKL